MSAILKTFAIGLGLLAVPRPSEPGGDIALPGELSRYREWTPLLKEPRVVSMGAWGLCRDPTAEEVREFGGPHARRLVMVYGNAIAAGGFSPLDRSAFATGAIIVKEKLSGSDENRPDGVAFMVKRGTAEFRDSGGWEFLFYPRAAFPSDKRRTHEHCAACHRRNLGRDSVLGEYDPPRTPAQAERQRQLNKAAMFASPRITPVASPERVELLAVEDLLGQLKPGESASDLGLAARFRVIDEPYPVDARNHTALRRILMDSASYEAGVVSGCAFAPFVTIRHWHGGGFVDVLVGRGCSQVAFAENGRDLLGYFVLTDRASGELQALVAKLRPPEGEAR